MNAPAAPKLPAENRGLKYFLQLDPWLAIIIASFFLLAWVSWGKLAEPIWDTSHEVEIPARLLAGQVLYRDVETYYGPLAYYANALALLVFGHYLEVFYVVGLVLALATTLLVYTLAKRLTNAPWAVACTVCILIYCVFSPLGLFNFIVPYSYGTVYATVLCLLGFTALDRYTHTNKFIWLVIAASTCGFAGLAKQEYGVAAIAGLLIGVNLGAAKSFKAKLGQSLLILSIASVCVILPLTLLAQQTSWEQLQSSLLPLSKSQILKESGLFDVSPAKTLGEWKYKFKTFIVTSLVVWGAIAIAYGCSKTWLRLKPIWQQGLIELAIGVAVSVGGLVSLRLSIPFQPAFKIFLGVSLLVLGILVAARWKLKSVKWIDNLIKFFAVVISIGFSLSLLHHSACCADIIFHPLGNMVWLPPLLVGWFALDWRQLSQHKHSALLWTLLVFSVLLNARFLFYINFYGLYAVTAILLFCTLLYRLTQKTSLPIIKYLLICLLIGGSINLVSLSQYRYPVQSTQGTLYIKDAQLAAALNQTIGIIKSSKATSVLVVPEGGILNFLTETHAPSREIIFIPGILSTALAEKDFITRMQNNPPQLIVYVDIPFFWLKPGYRTYAAYNPLVDGWIKQHPLVYTSQKLVYYDKKWAIRIYAPK
jgi:hypothetical protein